MLTVADILGVKADVQNAGMIANGTNSFLDLM
jgi:hypothetical protein